MAGSRSSHRSSSSDSNTPGSKPDETNPPSSGYFIVTFDQSVVGDQRAVQRELKDLTGIRSLAASSEFADGAMALEEVEDEECLYFNHLGIAAIKSDGDRHDVLTRASASEASNVLAVEPDYLARESEPAPAYGIEYLRGYRDAINDLIDKLIKGGTPESEVAEAAIFADSSSSTWGLQATKVNLTSLTGRGAKIAVLDTGLDFNHVDFQNRGIVSKSFVAGESAQDGRGHGTHCAGTIYGPKRPASGRRYGIAFDAQLLIGKVLSNAGTGWTRQIVAAMDWAVAQSCHVISMSLGTDTSRQLIAYGEASKRALDAGCLVVAAAGNNADRPASTGYVEPPANSKFAMAVGALSRQSRIAPFSARSNAGQDGGKVDIAAPGMAVYSSTPGSTYGLKDGTSMATPHVAGIAALWYEKTQKRGRDLFAALQTSAASLSGVDSLDCGAGLVQAP